MKKRDVELILRPLGFVQKGGGSHDKWTFYLTGQAIVVPRHRDINEFTAQGIIRKAKQIAKEAKGAK